MLYKQVWSGVWTIEYNGNIEVSVFFFYFLEKYVDCRAKKEFGAYILIYLEFSKIYIQ